MSRLHGEASAGTSACTVAVVLGAGQGTRMGGAGNKVLLPLGGKPLLVHAVEIFERALEIDAILVVAHPEEVEQCRKLAVRYGLRKVTRVIPGGASRHQSEYRALNALREPIITRAIQTIVIHDGARPFVTPLDVARLIQAAQAEGGALLAAAVDADEVIAQADEQGEITTVYPAGELWRAQTPQAFEASMLLDAYDAAARGGFEGTDTATSFEHAGWPVRVVPGSPTNIKVTTPQDLVWAEALLRRAR
jgi:2-C-methyl-D-erythritol 4-phosphate cytidylyltransferase